MKENNKLYEQLWDHKISPACFTAVSNRNLAHFHSSVECIFVRTGALQAIVNGRRYMVQGPGLLLVPSYATHMFETPVYCETYVLIVPLTCTPFFEKAVKGRAFVSLVYTNPPGLEEIEACMERLCGLMDKPDSQRVKGYIYIILGRLLEEMEAREGEGRDELQKIQEILQYIQDHLDRPLTVDSLARHFGYSPSRFSHLFNGNVGCSLPRYLGVQRAKRAADLLLYQDLSVSEAAMAVGFESLRSFYRVFKEAFHITPTAYIRQNREEGEEKADEM